MSRTVDPAKMLASWQKGMQGASQKYIDGINAYQGNPMALAATPQAMAAYLTGVQNSINNGKRQRGLERASPQFWKSQATSIGAARLSSGATKGAAKYGAAAQRWAGVFTQASAAAAAIARIPGDSGNAKARFGAALDVIMGAKASGT